MVREGERECERVKEMEHEGGEQKRWLDYSNGNRPARMHLILLFLHMSVPAGNTYLKMKLNLPQINVLLRTPLTITTTSPRHLRRPWVTLQRDGRKPIFFRSTTTSPHPPRIPILPLTQFMQFISTFFFYFYNSHLQITFFFNCLLSIILNKVNSYPIAIHKT